MNRSVRICLQKVSRKLDLVVIRLGRLEGIVYELLELLISLFPRLSPDSQTIHLDSELRKWHFMNNLAQRFLQALDLSSRGNQQFPNRKLQLGIVVHFTKEIEVKDA